MSAAGIRHIQIVMAIILAIGASFYLHSPAVADTPPVQQWAQRFTVNVIDSTVAAIAVDGSGSAYVTGYAYNGSNMDMVTIKYSPAGIQQWIKWYNHTGNINDVATDIAVDTGGNAYVSGYGGNASGNMDAIAVKYGTDGTQLWARAYDNTSRDELAWAITLDGHGNVVLTGKGAIAAGNDDYLTVKYDTAGNLQWASYYDGMGSNQSATSIAVDQSGNAYVTGESYNTGGNVDYATVKYRGTDGAQLWASRYDGPVDGDDYAKAVAVDAGGNAYVTGTSNIAANSDYLTIKYGDSDGAQLWWQRFDGPVHGDDTVYGLALDSGGNAFITGTSRNADGKQDMCTIKYSSAGAQQWVSRYIGPANTNALGYAIAMDESGNAYITGWSRNAGGRYDYATVKYNTGGTELWAVRYDGPSGLNDMARGIAVSGSDVYVTGRSANVIGRDDYATVKYGQGSTVAAVNPAGGTQGQCPLNVIIAGNNFVGATAVSFGAGINVNSFTVDNPSQITAVICISDGAAAGPRPVSVTTPLGTATLQAGFTVNELPRQFPVGIGTSPHASPAVTAPTNPGPLMVNPVILVQAASLSATTVAPGMPVTITADVANRSTANGSKNIQVYVNGQLEASKGVPINSGRSTQVSFSVSRGEPGTYTVYVDGTNAGSFKVDQFSPDIILFISGALVLFALVAGAIYMTRRPTNR